MDIPVVHLLLLEQGNHSFKDHTRDFLDLECLTPYLDHSVCVYFNERSMARLSVEGLQGSFAEYVQFTLAPLWTHGPARGELCLVPIQLIDELENIIPQGLPSVQVSPSSKSPVSLMVSSSFNILHQ